MLCNIDGFIAAYGSFDGTRGFRQPGTLGHSDLERSNEEKHMHGWLLRASRLFGQVTAFIAAAGTLGHRRAVGATIADSGHHSRPGSIHRFGLSLARITGLFGASPSSRAPCRLPSLSGPAVGRGRAAPELSETSWHSRAFRFGAGSFEGLSNTRCGRRAAQ